MLAFPRPSVNLGASIERVFGRSTVRTKPGLKGRYSLARYIVLPDKRIDLNRLVWSPIGWVTGDEGLPQKIAGGLIMILGSERL